MRSLLPIAPQFIGMPEQQRNEKAAEWLLKKAVPVVLASGAGGLVSLISTSNWLQVPVGAGILGGGTILYALVEPTLKKIKKGADQIGEASATAAEKTAQNAIAKATGVDAKYLEAQKLDCQTDRCQGIMQSYVPLLEEIFVDLTLDTGAIAAGWQTLQGQEREQLSHLQSRHFKIWHLLKQAEQQPLFRQMAIVAWGGFGKTTLLKHIAYIYSSQQQQRYGVSARVPVLLSLGDCWKKCLATQELTGAAAQLGHVIEMYHVARLPGGGEVKLPPDWAKNLLKQGKMLVLLDGLDEVPKDKQAVIATWINQQMQQYSKSASIFILTSRPKAYRQQAETNRLEMRMTLWVEPFDLTQQRQFVQQCYLYQERYANNGRDGADVRAAANEAAEELLSQIQARPEIQDLASIPLLLNMITAFHRLNPTAKLPDRRVELYQGICDLQLKHRPGAKALETLLIESDAQKILQRLALEMLLNGREKSIDRTTLRRRLAAHLQAENETAEAQQFLDAVVQISELLVEKDADTYEFAHWSFQEYLAAREILQQQQESLLYERFTDLEWKPTLLLYAAQVKNPSSLIQAMLDRGAADLAYACLPETTKQIPPALTAAIEQLRQTVETSRYAALEAMMQAGQWREADQETYRLMITTVGKEEGQWFDRKDLENFPCEDLLILDRLWVQYSNGKFGFSVQKKIYAECGATLDGKYPSDEIWEKFGDRVGWRKDNHWVSSTDLKYDPLNSLIGELPRGLVGWGLLGVWVGWLVLFSRVETCKL